MRNFNYSMKSQKGFLAIVAVIFILIIAFLGVAVTNMFFSSSTATVRHFQSDNAFYLAEAGLEHATHKMLETTAANRIGCNTLSTTAISNTLGSGGYTVSATDDPFYAGTQVAATALSGAVTAAATTIPVTSTTGYPTSGRIMVDGEFINYPSVTSTSFTNVTRGVDGSTATTHVAGTPIGQYQCTLTATGAVPSIASPNAKRTLQENVTLQEAWAIGTANGNYNFAHYNNPTDNSWYNYGIGGGIDLFGAYMNSYADGWFVGASGVAAHWNGNFNTIVMQTLTPAVTYRSVWCTSYNLCHAVGDVSLTPVIQVWNGSTWTRQTITLATTNLKSVQCSASNNCWAVGDSAGTDYFYQWNGTTWAKVAVTLTATAFPFNGVFCNTTTDCWAVGNSAFARKNGATWANFTTGIVASQYNGIFCNSTNDCWAVGQINGAKDLFMHWNGSAWSRDASNPTPVANLNSVNCFNSSDCWAVGGTAANAPVFVHWDGTSWTQFTSVSNGALPVAPLRAVTVTGPSTQPTVAWSETFS